MDRGPAYQLLFQDDSQVIFQTMTIILSSQRAPVQD